MLSELKCYFGKLTILNIFLKLCRLDVSRSHTYSNKMRCNFFLTFCPLDRFLPGTPGENRALSERDVCSYLRRSVHAKRRRFPATIF